MKRGTPRHPKVADLAIRLGIPNYAAVGLLEMLWHFTAEFCHQGDIGRFSDDAIAKALCWDGASTRLVSSLIESNWVDQCACHRLRVHDWPDHADQTVERVLAKRNLSFLACYKDASSKLGSSYDKTSQPSPSPSPSPIPIPISTKHPSGATRHVKFEKPTIETVKLHFAKIGLPESEAEKFFAHYESNGWVVGRGRAPVKSWQACAVTWKHNWQEWRKPVQLGYQP